MTISEKITAVVRRFRWPLLLGGGVLFGLTVIFPQIGLLEWVALIPALAVLLVYAPDSTVKLKRLYGMGFGFSMAFMPVNFHWFLYMYPLDFAGMSRPASALVVGLAWIGLSLFQALGMALLFPLMGIALRGRWLSRRTVLHPILFAALWTVLEWWWAHSGWSGVPWARLSLGQAHILPMLQSAYLFGAYGITFLIVIVNGFLCHMLLHPSRRVLCGVVAGGLFLGNLGFGFIRMATVPAGGETVVAAAIQGNKSSLEYWSSNTMDEVMNTYEELTHKAASEGATLIVWPETGVPANIDRNQRVYDWVTELAAECEVTILAGVFTRVEEGSKQDYNSIVAVLPDGTVHETVYNKRNPVPFGEFVPFRNLVMTLVPPLAEINTLDEDIPAGEDSEVFDLALGAVGPLICFDSIYECNAHDSIRNGAELITVSTNDSWFQDSRGVWMHHAQSRLRAIETGRYIVRSAVTGVSSIITPTGDAVELLDPLERGYVLAEVEMRQEITPYTVMGDVLVYFMLAVGALALLWPTAERWRRRVQDV